MGIKKIPAKEIHVCDICGKERERPNPCAWGTLRIIQSGCDYQGNAVADGTVTRTLCDTCKPAIVAAINEASESIKGQTNDQ